MKKIVRFLLLIAIFFASACSIPIKSEDRDTSATHFGKWQVKVAGTPKIFETGTHRVSCWNMSTVSYLQIIDGRVSASFFGSFLKGFINSQGRFSSTSGSSGNRFILKGKLDAEKGTGSGRLTQALSDLGGQGCSSKVDFVRAK